MDPPVDQSKSGVVSTRSALRTPRAAAVAGILFAVLFTLSIGLMRLAIPEAIVAADATAWLQNSTRAVQFAIALLLAINLSLWAIMVFPAWVFVISGFILVRNLRSHTAEAEGVVGAGC